MMFPLGKSEWMLAGKLKTNVNGTLSALQENGASGRGGRGLASAEDVMGSSQPCTAFLPCIPSCEGEGQVTVATIEKIMPSEGDGAGGLQCHMQMDEAFTIRTGG